MSVNMNDDYLDELLDTIETIIAPKEEPVVSTPEPELQPEPLMDEASFLGDEIGLEEPFMEELGQDIPSDISIMDLFNAEEGNDSGTEPSYKTLDEGDSDIGDLLAVLASESSDSPEAVSQMSEDDISALLDAASSTTESSEQYSDEAKDADVKELLKQFTDDEDLSDIQDILEKNDNMEAVDESLLDVPNIGIFEMENNEEDASKEDEQNTKKGLFSFLKKKEKEEKETEEKKTRKEKKKKEKKNKKKKEDPVEADVATENPEVDSQPVEIMEETEELGIGMEELIDVEGMSDIDQLLSGGAFFGSEEPDEMQEESDDGKKKKAKKKEKKESLFSKVFAMLTEEVEDDEVPEAKATGITDENKNILEELSKEDKKKAKKEKKDKKKDKKAKNQKEGEEGSDEESENKKGKKKKEKKKREKKVKPPKVEEITKPEKKLPRKSVISIFALCFSILAAILIMQNITSKTANLKEAEWAFNHADYAVCYQNLLGIERNEEQEALFQKSAVILAVQRKLDSYHNFMMMESEVEAVNALLEGVLAYREQQEAAIEWDVTSQITEIYQVICDKLKVFGISDEDVEEILGYDSKVTYTKRLDSIVNGTPFVIEEPILEEDNQVEEAQPLEDVLPWEEDFLPDDTREVSAQSTVVQESGNDENSDTEEVPMSSPSQGETVVVGSAPVNINGTDTSVTGGQNVGSGNTNVSVQLNNGNAVVNGF